MLRRARRLSGREWRDLGRAHAALLRAYRSVRSDESGLSTCRNRMPGQADGVGEVAGGGGSDRAGCDAPSGAGSKAPNSNETQIRRARELALALERSMEYGPFRFRCLVRALALRRMLEEEGIEGGAVRIGVRRDGTEEFAAHAWVELDGAPLLESPGLLEAYTPLPELDVFPERRASRGR